MRAINETSVQVVGRFLKSTLKRVTILCLLLSLIVPALAAEGASENQRARQRPRGYIGSNSALDAVMTAADGFQGGGQSDSGGSDKAQGGAPPQGGGQSDSGGSDKAQGGASPEGEDVADNGTNPASFGFKFMPYYRYTELDNGIKSIEDLTLFALIPGKFISPFTAFVIEWPVSKTFDAGALAEDVLAGLPVGCGRGRSRRG